MTSGKSTRSAARHDAVMMCELTDVEIVRYMLDSHRDYVGTELIDRSGDPLVDAQRLFGLDAVVLSHDGGADPRFVYANLAAARLWRMDVDELVGMPSRLSAPPNHRDERQAMLHQAAKDGVLHGYTGTRVAKDGTLFVIEDATLWTVDYPHGSGQAVVFRTWHDN
jgi:PAS domain-containing protein